MKRVLFALSIIVICISACRKEDTITTDKGVKLTLSTSKVQFDTVFTAMGSATRIFKFKNTNKNGVKTNITLAGGKNSYFRINVDGQPGTSFTNKTLAGGDSMYIFVEVTIDPDSSKHNPFVLDDSIIFQTNGNVQYVKLEAWGQNAFYIAPGTTDGVYTKNDAMSGTYDNTKPYVILGYATIAPGKTLTITKGAKIYCHAGTVIDIYGTLIIQGEKDNPVIIQGDRLEHDPTYSKGPGQWQGIYFHKFSAGNEITHAIIQNGDFGIFDSAYNGISTSIPKIKLHKTIIRNMTYNGIFSIYSSEDMDACLIYNTGREAFYANGGNYNIVQSVFDNSNSIFVRQYYTLGLRNYAFDNNSTPLALNVNFYNDIIWGSEDDEIGFDSLYTTKIPVQFQNCLIKSKSFKNKFNPTNFINLSGFGYFNLNNEDYHLPSSSTIKGASSLPITTTSDLEDIKWLVMPPGCYESRK